MGLGKLPPMGVMTFNPEEGIVIAPARVEAAYPNAYRIAVYPDGRKTVQGAYAWTQGDTGGVIWKDLPEVQVGEDGQ